MLEKDYELPAFYAFLALSSEMNVSVSALNSFLKLIDLVVRSIPVCQSTDHYFSTFLKLSRTHNRTEAALEVGSRE